MQEGGKEAPAVDVDPGQPGNLSSILEDREKELNKKMIHTCTDPSIALIYI